jgi:hypothetical protein
MFIVVDASVLGLVLRAFDTFLNEQKPPFPVPGREVVYFQEPGWAASGSISLL